MNGIINALNNNDTTHNYDYTILNDAPPLVIDYDNTTKYKNLNELKIQEIERLKINVNDKITKEKKCYGNGRCK